jgi:hypothetical protein
MDLPSTLYHMPGSFEAVAGIARRGLVPGSELGQRRYSDFYSARPGCVYMATGASLITMPTFVPVLTIDTAHLDPELVCADEDHLAIYTWGCREDTHVEIGYELPDCFTRRNGRTYWNPDGPLERPPVRIYQGGASLGAWAARNAHVLDRPDAAALSLRLGSCAYKGAIPPEAIGVNDDKVVDWLLLRTETDLAVRQKALHALLEMGAGGEARQFIENNLALVARKIAA